MLPTTPNEKLLFDEVRDLNQDDFEIILRMIHFMKNEILHMKHVRQEPEIIQYAGMLKDISDEDTERFTAAIQRTGMFGKRELGAKKSFITKQ